MTKKNDQIKKLEASVSKLVEVLWLTAEYVGHKVLPPVEGWAWYEEMKKHDPTGAEVLHQMWLTSVFDGDIRAPDLDMEQAKDKDQVFPDEKKTSLVVHPAHYNTGKIEVWDFIIDQGLTYCLGDATKYICRAGKKDSGTKRQDIHKAIQYLEREDQRLAEEEANDQEQ